ncbi:transposase [Streptococcus equi subsp. zooepidemicus]|uniref:transposase n=1 Tax=Streptococcus equi TaxID=1336 RepID=UPI00294AB918|nr:transposase [Streptococcus equi]WOK52489.1 transposase [Streptococcus equi subsp. zooepidemicus]WOK52677.1 transposase [Streptococcus equi subsp. zooepidemicus]WOK54442.1 transposase [Streptococcus equi subsp. zooepidemicus]WOK54629.1 transposase [Streptococcus equi subsp. zooepidemicus]
MQYDKTFKEEAVRLSDEIGLKNAATQLGISYYTLSGWRNKRNKYGQSAFPGSGYKVVPGDVKEQRIHDLERENAELKRSNEILQEALGFFAVRRKK